MNMFRISSLEAYVSNSYTVWCNQMGTVLGSFNMAYRDEDSILYLIHEKPKISKLYYADLKFLRVNEENAYLKKYSTHNKTS